MMRPQRLLIIFHHLVIDQFSFPIVLEDLQTAYMQLSRGEALRLPPQTTSFKRWAELLADYASSPRIRQELDYWLELPWADICPLPVDYPGARGTDTEATTASLAASLSATATQALLHALPEIGNLQVLHVLLAALAEAFRQWTGEPLLLVETVHHGRIPLFEDLDLSRTAGWLTVNTPVLLDLRQVGTPRELLRAIKAQVQAIPNMGIG